MSPKHSVWIAPSILSADFSRLGDEVKAVLKAGADLIHFDVMDNHYVPNLTVGPLVCESLRKTGIDAIIDVHLMVQPVDAMIQAFAKAGASIITIHPEASDDVDVSLALIKQYGCHRGLAINPNGDVGVLEPYLDRLDLVLLMSVNPGFAGQAFMPIVYNNIKQVRQILDERGSRARLSVDGGISLDNVASVIEAGADTIVAGSAVFSADDYRERLRAFRACL